MPDLELANRLKRARESLGLSLSEAANRLGFANYQTLSSIEAGEREVKVSEIARFSKVYFYSMSRLLGAPEYSQTPNFLWRNPPTTEQKKQEIEGALIYRCEQYRLLERLLNEEVRAGFLDISIDKIRTNADLNYLADQYRDLLGLRNRPAFTLQKVLEQDFGVKILFYTLIKGSSASMIHPDLGTVIVINTDEAPWRRNYDLAHELFHLITWKTVSQEYLKDQAYFEELEKKAEKFASMLLLPEKEIQREISRRQENQPELTYSDLIDIAIDFGVSAVALLYRLAHLRFIKWEMADQLAKDDEFFHLTKRKRVRERESTPVSERFHSLAIRCLRKGLVSRGKFAEIVEIDRNEIEDFIEQTGLMVSEGRPVEIMAA